MNIQEYISSGIVESYVLGLLTAQERFEFELMCEKHPEVKAAREAFELSVENQAMESGITPPAVLKQKIADHIFQKEKSTVIKPLVAAPVRKINWWQYAVAASLVLLAVSIWLILDLKTKNDRLASSLEQTNQRLAQVEADAQVIQKPEIKMVGLGGTANSPSSFATVYWDTTSHDVYLLVNNLPKPASDEQYQLWAILNGQPVDMGYIEITEKPLQLYRMKNAQSAQAFAITLEKKDGNPAPDLDRIFVMGNL